VDVDVDAMSFKIINDCGQLNVPLVELTVYPFKGNLREWFTPNGAGETKISLGANFYNNKLSVWEPLIEKWVLAVEVRSCGQFTFTTFPP